MYPFLNPNEAGRRFFSIPEGRDTYLSERLCRLGDSYPEMRSQILNLPSLAEARSFAQNRPLELASSVFVLESENERAWLMFQMGRMAAVLEGYYKDNQVFRPD